MGDVLVTDEATAYFREVDERDVGAVVVDEAVAWLEEVTA